MNDMGPSFGVVIFFYLGWEDFLNTSKYSSADWLDPLIYYINCLNFFYLHNFSLLCMRASGLSTSNCEKNVKKCYTTISLRSPTNTDAKISVLLESAKIFAKLFLGLASAEQFVSKKSQKCMLLVLVPFET